jgi:hypothetical protein
MVPGQKFSFNSARMVMLLELLGKRNPYFARFATAILQQF